MAFKVGDRIKEAASTTGTGSFTLTGAVAGFKAFSSLLTANGDTTWYCAVNGTEWEIGLGTRTSAAVLARTTVLKSSNADGLVNFTVAPVVFGTVPASMFPPAGFAAFNVGSAGPQGPFAASTATKLLLTGAKEYDPENVWDTANSRFTAPLTGAYEFSIKMGRTNPTVEITAGFDLYKNGGLYTSGFAWTGKWGASIFTHSLKLTAGDIMEFYFTSNEGTTTTTGVRVQGKLLRAL
jgi:hypothetical protein